MKISSQINPSRFVSENYYEVDGMLTTKLQPVEQVVISKPKEEMPKCSSEDDAVVGKNKVHYLKHAAFCLETQNFPDAVHHVRKKMRQKVCAGFQIIFILCFRIIFHHRF